MTINKQTGLVISITFLFSVIILSSIIEQTFSIIIIFTILFLFSFICIFILSSAKYFNILIEIFTFALVLNISLMLFTAFYFKWNLNTALGGNDEARFFIDASIITKYWGYGVWKATERTGSFGYPYTMSVISYLANLFGRNNPLNLKIASAFVGSYIPITIFYLHIKYFNINLSKKIAKYTALFPVLIYYSSLCVRDIYLAFFTMLFFIFLTKKRNKILNSFILILLLFIIYTFRIEHSAYLSITWLSFLFYKNIDKFDFKNVMKIVIILIMLVSIVVNFYTEIQKFTFEQFIKTQQSYTEMRLKKASVDSLGQKISQLPVPINYIFRFGAMMLTGFPPHKAIYSGIIKKNSIVGYTHLHSELNFSPGRLFKFLGPLVWYFILPYVIYGFIKRNKIFKNKREYLFIIYISLLYVFMVSLIVLEMGRLVPVYPILFSFGLCTAFSLNKQKIYRINFFSIVIICGIYFLYFMLKLK